MSNPATAILADVAATIQSSSHEKVTGNLKTLLVDRELQARVELADKALTKKSEAKKELDKLVADNVQVDGESGKETKNFTQARWKERQKALDTFNKLEAALDAALEDTATVQVWNKLRELVNK